MLESVVLDSAQVEFYQREGYLLLKSVLPSGILARLRGQTDERVAAAAKVLENNAIYDLEDTHAAERPRVRRIKVPHTVMPAVDELVRSPVIGSIVAQLLGTGVRLQTTKLNMKSASYGAAVEWHQDWAFYPHTNDDLLAMGVMFDDCDAGNAPLMMMPGSHRGPVFDHHAGGFFCGAMDPAALDFSQAVALTAPAGSLTFHHVRMVHGSALNRSPKPRRLLLAQYTAVDAWPLIDRPDDIAAYDAQIIYGEPTIRARLADVPVRLPLPPAPYQGSIYENQRTLGERFFQTHESGINAAAQ
ncbi:MAG: phytanoyl-CoA dioxygenase family protein [Gammaproteobacteria bacterium]|nr:phytanoyl-CoA dioxygenase family protein [Gammaproteobacteria bacterium]